MKTFLKYVTISFIFLLFGCAHVPENLYLKPLFGYGKIEVYKRNGREIFKSDSNITYQFNLGITCMYCLILDYDRIEDFKFNNTIISVYKPNNQIIGARKLLGEYEFQNNLSNKNEIEKSKILKIHSLVRKQLECSPENTTCIGTNVEATNLFETTALFANQTWIYEFDSNQKLHFKCIYNGVDNEIIISKDR